MPGYDEVDRFPVNATHSLTQSCHTSFVQDTVRRADYPYKSAACSPAAPEGHGCTFRIGQAFSFNRLAGVWWVYRSRPYQNPWHMFYRPWCSTLLIPSDSPALWVKGDLWRKGALKQLYSPKPFATRTCQWKGCRMQRGQVSHLVQSTLVITPITKDQCMRLYSARTLIPDHR